MGPAVPGVQVAPYSVQSFASILGRHVIDQLGCPRENPCLLLLLAAASRTWATSAASPTSVLSPFPASTAPLLHNPRRKLLHCAAPFCPSRPLCQTSLPSVCRGALVPARARRRPLCLARSPIVPPPPRCPADSPISLYATALRRLCWSDKHRRSGPEGSAQLPSTWRRTMPSRCSSGSRSHDAMRRH